MTNVIISTCFDLEFRPDFHKVQEMFPSPVGKEDVSTSMENMFKALSMMKLTDEFVMVYINRMDFLKLYQYGSITKKVLIERLDAVIDFALYGSMGDLYGRLNLVRMMVDQHFTGVEKREFILEVFKLLQYLTVELLYSETEDEEVDFTDEEKEKFNILSNAVRHLTEKYMSEISNMKDLSEEDIPQIVKFLSIITNNEISLDELSDYTLDSYDDLSYAVVIALTHRLKDPVMFEKLSIITRDYILE